MEEIIAPLAEATNETQPSAGSDSTSVDPITELINRRTGSFDVKINYQDLKYIKNSVNQKVEWKGPNEAYLVIMAVLTIDNILQDMDQKEMTPTLVKIPATTIESLNFFLGRMTGKGIESAQRLFSISMTFRQAMESIRKIDEELEALKSAQQTEKTA